MANILDYIPDVCTYTNAMNSKKKTKIIESHGDSNKC